MRRNYQIKAPAKFRPPPETAIVPYVDDGNKSEASVESVEDKINVESVLNVSNVRNHDTAWKVRMKLRNADDEGLHAVAHEHNIPVDDLEDESQLPELIQNIEELETLTSTRLKNAYMDLGYVAADDMMGRTELKELVKEAYKWKAMKASALTTVCMNRGLQVDTEQPREDLLRLLADNTWENLGIPVSRFPNIGAARAVLEHVQGLENCSSSELGEMSKRNYLPPAATRGTPEKLAAQLKQVFIWEQLSLEELQRDCRARSLSSTTESGLSPDRARRELLSRLKGSIHTITPEMRGIPVERLGSAEAVEEVLREVDRLQNLGTFSLQAECHKLGVHCDSVMDMSALVDRLRDVLVWKHLPLPTLLQECNQRKLFCLESDSRDIVISALLEAQDREMEMAELGIPKQLIGDDATVSELMEQWKTVDMMPIGDLIQWSEAYGLPFGNELKTKALQSLFKKTMAWEVLSLQDLREESTRLGLAVPEWPEEEFDEEQLQQQQQQLIVGLLFHESIDLMSKGTLLSWYETMALPSVADVERSAVQSLMKKLVSFDSSSLQTLKKTCEDRGILVGQEGEEEQQRCQLMRRHLMFDECLQVVTMETLRELYEGLQLPELKSVQRADLQAFMQKVAHWQMLSLPELQEVCEKLEVPMTEEDVLPTADESRLLLHLYYHECIEFLGTEELQEWISVMGVDMIVPAKRKDLQKLLRKFLTWQVLPLDELKQHCSEVCGAGCSSSVLGDEEQQHALMQRLAVHERVEGMSPMDLADWYKSTGLPLEKSMKRTDLRDVLKKVMTWRLTPLMDLQEECERAGIIVDDLVEEDELVQMNGLVERLFFNARVEDWDARGFEAKRIGGYVMMDSVIQVVSVCDELDRMDEKALNQSYQDHLPGGSAATREEIMDHMRHLLIWSNLPWEELLKDCEARGLADVAKTADEEQRDVLLSHLLDSLMQPASNSRSSRSSRSRLPRALTGEAPAPKELVPKEPVIHRPEPPPPEEEEEETAAPAPPERPSRGERQPFPGGSRLPKSLQREPPRLQPHPDGADGAAGGLEQGGSSCSKQREGEIAARDFPRLKDGVTLFINLDRRTDRKLKMEQLTAPHAWLAASLQRIPAIDGRTLEWKSLVSDQSFTRQAASTSARAEKEKRATIGATPHECSTHLTLGGCGCALSHRKAWDTLLKSNSRWALILEDDLNGVCENFDQELDRVLSLLPADWNLCYLGFHTGKMLQKGARFRGPLQKLKATDGWMPGLWGYLISKPCARNLIRQCFPMSAQVDTEVGCRVMQKPGAFAVPETEFLLFSPPTERSMDTDVQTFQKDMR